MDRRIVRNPVVKKVGCDNPQAPVAVLLSTWYVFSADIHKPVTSPSNHNSSWNLYLLCMLSLES